MHRLLLLTLLCVGLAGCGDRAAEPYRHLEKAFRMERADSARAEQLFVRAVGELERREAQDSVYARHVLGNVHLWAHWRQQRGRAKADAHFEADSALGLALLQESAEAGHALSFRALGRIFAFREQSEVAMEYFRRGAERGDGYSQAMLGRAYTYGDGVEQDFERAVYWLHRAMQEGDKEARRGAAQSLRADVHNGVIPDSLAAEALALARQIPSPHHDGTGPGL